MSIVLKFGDLNLEPSGPVQAYNGTALPLEELNWLRDVLKCVLTQHVAKHFSFISSLWSVCMFNDASVLKAFSACTNARLEIYNAGDIRN